MIEALRQNWKVYTMEAICLGIFMISASAFATVLEYRGSVVHLTLTNDFLRLFLMGIAMGATATLIIYSPMGKLSGAHMNPAITLTFLGLGKIKLWDALYYTIFQCAGGILAVMLIDIIIGKPFEEAPVQYVVTIPGKYGVTVALIVETVIAFCMMFMVLVTSNHSKYSKYTGAIAGIFVASYVILTSPISGFGMNPARTLASAFPSGIWTDFWLYCLAPFAGMFIAAAVYKKVNGKIICAKFHHSIHFHCIFNCGYCKHAHFHGEENP